MLILVINEKLNQDGTQEVENAIPFKLTAEDLVNKRNVFDYRFEFADSSSVGQGEASLCYARLATKGSSLERRNSVSRATGKPRGTYVCTLQDLMKFLNARSEYCKFKRSNLPPRVRPSVAKPRKASDERGTRHITLLTLAAIKPDAANFSPTVYCLLQRL